MRHNDIIRFALHITCYLSIIQRGRSDTFHKIPLNGLAVAASDLEWQVADMRFQRLTPIPARIIFSLLLTINARF